MAFTLELDNGDVYDCFGDCLDVRGFSRVVMVWPFCVEKLLTKIPSQPAKLRFTPWNMLCKTLCLEKFVVAFATFGKMSDNQ